MLWELDVCDVLALCHPGDRTHQHIVQAARDAVLQRIATSSRGWPKGVLTMLQVGFQGWGFRPKRSGFRGAQLRGGGQRGVGLAISVGNQSRAGSHSFWHC